MTSPYTPIKTFALTALLSFAGLVHAADTRVLVLNNYADIAQAGYSDSLASAKHLKQAIENLVDNPGSSSLENARNKWRDARIPYMQTEVFRFGNAMVDDWEGKVNAWPLDEGLIDYVDTSFYGSESDDNIFYTANVVANQKVTFSGQQIDASTITKDLLTDSLHEADGYEANVATGYHAIEFLLWGQDTNGTGPGAGNRPASDFDADNCTNGNCDRRAAYLKTATDLLVDDLMWMGEQWKPEGAARQALLSDIDAGISAILTGMGSLSYGELAGERMKLGLIVHDPEEEHDCFSDNTHYSHFYDAKGIQNVFLGEYARIDGSRVSGPGIDDLLESVDPDLRDELDKKLELTIDTMEVLVQSAMNGEFYDQMIAEGNDSGNSKVQSAIDALVDQTNSIEKIVQALGISSLEIEGSDSLDAPETIGS